MKILVLNSGSSSQKTCLYDIGETLPDNPPACLWEGKIEWHGQVAEAVVKNSHGVARQARVEVSSRAEAVEHLLRTLWSGETQALAAASEIDVVGHRVVHGGPKYEQLSSCSDLFLKSPSSIPVSIAKCRCRRLCIQALMNGSQAAFAAMDSTASIIGIVPRVPRGSFTGTWNPSNW